MNPRVQKIFYYFCYAFLICFIMVFFVHGDLVTDAFTDNQVGLGHWNIYKWYFNHPMLNTIPSPMLPVYYESHGLYMAILRFFSLNPVDLSYNYPPMELFGKTQGIILGLGAAILKMPNLLMILASLFFIKKIALVGNLDVRLTSLVWLSSPLILCGSLMQGNMDIMPAFITLIALYFLSLGENYWCMIFIGIAAATKNYSLLFIMPIAIITARHNVLKMLGLMATSFGTYALILLPFLSQAFIERVINWPEGSFIFLNVINMTLGAGPGAIYMFFLGYFLLICYLCSNTIEEAKIFQYVCWTCMTIVCLLLCTSPWFPQWAIWFMPFAVFSVFKNHKTFICFCFLSLSIMLLSLILFPNNLDIQMARGYLPQFRDFYSYREILGDKFTYLFYTGVIALIITFVVLSFPNRKEKFALPIKLIVPMLFFPIVIYILLILSQPIFGYRLLQQTASTDKNVGEIRLDSPIIQEFKPEGRSFNVITLAFDNLGRKNSCQISIAIQELNDLKTQYPVGTFTADSLQNIENKKFRFSKITPPNKDTTYAVLISSNSKGPGQCLTIQAKAANTGTNLFVGKKEIPLALNMGITFNRIRSFIKG